MKLCTRFIRQLLLLRFLVEDIFSCDPRATNQLDGYSLLAKYTGHFQVPVDESESSGEEVDYTPPPTEPPYVTFYSMSVSSESDATALSKTLESAEPGSIVNVFWTGVVMIKATIEISNGVLLNVTGSSARESKVDGRTARRLFNVDDGSSLHLTNISLARGSGERMLSTPAGGAVYLTDRSNLIVLDSVFDSNVAMNGGEACG